MQYYCNLKLTVNACKSILTKKLKYKIVLQLGKVRTQQTTRSRW